MMRMLLLLTMLILLDLLLIMIMAVLMNLLLRLQLILMILTIIRRRYNSIIIVSKSNIRIPVNLILSTVYQSPHPCGVKRIPCLCARTLGLSFVIQIHRLGCEYEGQLVAELYGPTSPQEEFPK